MLNFRKLKQDFSPAILKEGRGFHEKKMVLSTKILALSPSRIRLHCRVQGGFDKSYRSEVEIDRQESMILDADCDCSYKYDCQHIAAVLFYLEEHFNEVVLAFSQEHDIDRSESYDSQEKEKLKKAFKEAEIKEIARKGEKQQKELLKEYVIASHTLGRSPFFLKEEFLVEGKAELAIIFSLKPLHPEFQLALRLPFRSKPLNVPHLKEFLDALSYRETLYIGSNRYFFTLDSFDAHSRQMIEMVMDYARFHEAKEVESNPRIAWMEAESLGAILAEASRWVTSSLRGHGSGDDSSSHAVNCHEESHLTALPCLYLDTLEEPLRLSTFTAKMRFELEYLETATPKILLNPAIVINEGCTLRFDEAYLFECAKPGMIWKGVYYSFPTYIKRKHLRHLSPLQQIMIPEPLFGTFVENSLPELMNFAEVINKEIIERFVTLPFTGKLGAICDINYLNGELEASLHFVYDKVQIPAAPYQLKAEHLYSFVTPEGILARNLTEEQKIVEEIFQGFIFDQATGIFNTKNDKKIVEFMTEVIPANQHRVKFNCPENLLDQFIYDETKFKLLLREKNHVDCYEVELKVDGHLQGISLDLLWDCLSFKRAFIELPKKKETKKKTESDHSQLVKNHKILVLDLGKLASIVHIFDDIGIRQLDNHIEERPLWSLASLSPQLFEGLPIELSMSDKLKQIQRQMLGELPITPEVIPSSIKCTSLRSYQTEGVHWLNRLRNMHLNGILADDMGLGKTLQAIIALTQNKLINPSALSIVVCPTSLVHNWREELIKFNPALKVLAVDGTPMQRKKLQTAVKHFDVIITSYTLLQKDIDFYKKISFSYAILDEAQHIKNRMTRNAKSVKMIQALHRLILTGTPLENSLEELWSLFDFLMPGLLSSYDRFIEKYIRNPSFQNGRNLEALKQKVSPFILRRMKKDVLHDLPPISEIVYHCHLSDMQRELYHSYANSAREELSQLVKKEGFDRIQIHILATLTRLKQICCHPAIFAKEKAESGDSAKYEMLIELLQNLIGGQHKTVIFSQYTKMLEIIRRDLERLGLKFSYLDGSSKNRLEIVKRFNENQEIPIFLVSLKAGGTGLNLVGADTVIHYDMWWNPATENQATDRIHRLGQKRSVSSYKLVTLGTIEEKILELQNRKKSLVKEIVTNDEEAIAKLTWEEVLELLKT